MRKKNNANTHKPAFLQNYKSFEKDYSELQTEYITY